jgi:hypothetical protein
MTDNRQLDEQMIKIIPAGQDTSTILKGNLTIPPKDAKGIVAFAHGSGGGRVVEIVQEINLVECTRIFCI